MAHDTALTAPCYCTALRKATRSVTGFYDAALTGSGMRITQYALLNHLFRLGPVSMNALSAAIRLERTTLIRNLDVLVRRNLVRATPGTSSREHQISLTEQGRVELEAVRPHWERAQSKIHHSLSANEQTLLHNLLQKLQKITS